MTDATIETTGMELAVPPDNADLDRAYTVQPYRDQLFSQIENIARKQAEGLDVENETDRKRLVSIAYNVARTKTAWDGIGKEKGDDARALLRALQEVRNEGVDRLARLQSEIRGPVTAWEEREAARKAALRERLAEIDELAHVAFTATADTLRARLAKIESITIGEEWEDAAEEAQRSLDTARMRVSEALAAAEAREAQAAELDKMRVHLEELRQKERERQDREKEEREAREKAKREAAEAKAREEREAREAEARKKAEEEAERQRLEAIERAKQEAAEAERKRLQAEMDAAAAEERRRAENARIRKRVLKEIAEDVLMAGAPEGAGPAIAQAIAEAIAGGKVRHVTIKF